MHLLMGFFFDEQMLPSNAGILQGSLNSISWKQTSATYLEKRGRRVVQHIEGAAALNSRALLS
jgi:hypothetical protein